jgi:hypothetical protein
VAAKTAAQSGRYEAGRRSVSQLAAQIIRSSVTGCKLGWMQTVIGLRRADSLLAMKFGRWRGLGPAGLILILSCCGNILILRSEAGRTMEWAQAHFFVGPVAVLRLPA